MLVVSGGSARPRGYKLKWRVDTSFIGAKSLLSRADNWSDTRYKIQHWPDNRNNDSGTPRSERKTFSIDWKNKEAIVAIDEKPAKLLIFWFCCYGWLVSCSLSFSLSARVNCGVRAVFVFDTWWHNGPPRDTRDRVPLLMPPSRDIVTPCHEQLCQPPPPIVSLMTIVMANMSWWKYSRSFLTIIEDSPWGANAVMIEYLNCVQLNIRI